MLQFSLPKNLFFSDGPSGPDESDAVDEPLPFARVYDDRLLGAALPRKLPPLLHALEVSVRRAAADAADDDAAACLRRARLSRSVGVPKWRRNGDGGSENKRANPKRKRMKEGENQEDERRETKG